MSTTEPCKPHNTSSNNGELPYHHQQHSPLLLSTEPPEDHVVQDSGTGRRLYRSPPSFATSTEPSNSIDTSADDFTSTAPCFPVRRLRKSRKSKGTSKDAPGPENLMYYPKNIQKVIVTAKARFQLDLCIEGPALATKEEMPLVHALAREAFQVACIHHNESWSYNIPRTVLATNYHPQKSTPTILLSN